SGAGSVWENTGVTVGGSWTGKLEIADGGLVDVQGATRVGSEADGAGQIAFNSGTLITRQLLAGIADLTGHGTINTGGLVSDIDLTFDATHGAQQQLILNSLPGQDIVINLDQKQNTPLGVGYRGAAELSVSQGVEVRSGDAYLGYHLGASGTATVSGPGSK